MDIISLGEPMMELSELVQPNGLTYYLPGFGGDTSNFAVAASRSGASVAYFTRIGKDAFGDRFLKLWEDEGIDTSLVVRDPESFTGMYFITYDKEGHKFTYFRKNSAASLMTPDEVPEEAIANSRLLHISGISQAISTSACDAVFKAVEVAKKAGSKISYDPNFRPRLWENDRARAVIDYTASLCDIFLPSLDEAEVITGIKSPEGIIEYYLGLGARIVALKMGKEGAIASDGSETAYVEGIKLETIDATGAGDTFDGFFVAMLLTGRKIAQALEYANVAAALSTRGHGAVAPIPRYIEVEDFLSKNRI